MDEMNEGFAEYVNLCLASKEWTQKDLATAVHMDYGAVRHKIHKSPGIWTVADVLKFSKALDVDPIDMFIEAIHSV